MDPVWVTGLKFVTWCRFFFDAVFYGVVCEFNQVRILYMGP